MTIEQEGTKAIQSTEVDDENVNLVVPVTENEVDTNAEHAETKYFPAVAVIS